MNMKLRNIPFSPPDMTEAEANEVRDAILSGWITTGPRTKKLEKTISEYVGTEKTVCLNSATAAMEMVLHLLGIGPGDEVIVPAYTYTATASVVRHVGATVVMVDSQKDCVEMDYDKLVDAITERTKVIAPVDLGGIVAAHEKVLEIVNRPEIRAKFTPANEIQKKFGRIVVSADCAHSFGASRHGVMAGAIADFSSFSFHAVKNFTTAEGGALTWNLPFGNEPVVMDADSFVPSIEGETWNEYLYRMSQLFSLHGQNKDALAKTKLGAWEYDVIGPWYKCNMTDVMAGMGLAQFERYPSMLNNSIFIFCLIINSFNNILWTHNAIFNGFHTNIMTPLSNLRNPRLSCIGIKRIFTCIKFIQHNIQYIFSITYNRNINMYIFTDRTRVNINMDNFCIFTKTL